MRTRTFILLVSSAMACTDATTTPDQNRLPLPLYDALVYATNVSDSSGDVAVLELKGNIRRVLTDATTADACPALSPDGNWIAYISKAKKDTSARFELRNNMLTLMRANGADKRTVAEISPLGSGCPIWSSASDNFALQDILSNQFKTSTSSRIRIFATDGTLLSSFDKLSTAILSFAPAGRSLLALAYDYSPNGGAYNMRVSTISMTGQETILVSGGTFISASMLGRRAYSCPGVCVSNADGSGALQRFSGPMLQPVIAADGNQIAYRCPFFTSLDLCLITPEGLKSGPFAVSAQSNAVWSSDSRFLVFMCGAAEADICSLDRDGGNLKNLTNTPGVYELNPSLAPISGQ